MAKGSTPQITLRVRPGMQALWEEAAALEDKPLATWLKDLATATAVEALKAADQAYGKKTRRNKPAERGHHEEVDGDYPSVVALRRK